MFTGLVQHVGTLTATEPRTSGLRLLIDAKGWAHHPTAGDSICVSGVCLTLAVPIESTRGQLAFDAVPETLAKTTLGALKPGGRVNLEHSATPTTLMGGHIVQGHVDGVGAVASVTATGEHRLRIRPPAGLMEFVTPKGSICVDGVSLTVAALQPREWFEVALIPVTLAKTSLGDLRAGSAVNLEADIIAKTMVHWAKNYRS